jgi:uncharacterized protein (TIGR03437 family)
LTVLGVNLASTEATARQSVPVPSRGGLTLEFTDPANGRTMLPLYYAGRDEVNAFVPEGVSPGQALLTISDRTGRSPRLSL